MENLQKKIEGYLVDGYKLDLSLYSLEDLKFIDNYMTELNQPTELNQLGGLFKITELINIEEKIEIHVKGGIVYFKK